MPLESDRLVFGLFFLPFFSFIALLCCKKISQKFFIWIPLLGIVVCFTASIALFFQIFNQEPIYTLVPWFEIGKNIFNIAIIIDYQSVIMSILVFFITLLVCIYSIEYKSNDRHGYRYYAYLSIFIAAMIGIVFSGNILVSFVFWEIVGFSSYLLIGFWYDKTKAVEASKKSFLVNRVADMFFLASILMLYTTYQTLDFHSLFVKITENPSNPILFWASLCFFVGCAGKSAQFPFHIWLPDAMEGPTPVSALLHAATMVAAGVYLLIRFSFIIHSDVSVLITVFGTITAFLGAFSALFQHDLKKTLAFSTISQLGMMYVAIGLKKYEMAYFHLFTHAFFKAGLFLCAGAVIHAYHTMLHGTQSNFDKQDTRYMGGLLKHMPIAATCFFISGASLAGLPLFSGFLSKDMIIYAVYQMTYTNSIYSYCFLVILCAAIFTAWYFTKLFSMIFLGQSRLHHIIKHPTTLHPKDNNAFINAPIMILAFLSISLLHSPTMHGEDAWFFKLFALQKAETETSFMLFVPAALSILTVIAALVFYNHVFKNNVGAFGRKKALMLSTQPISLLMREVYKISYNQFYTNHIFRQMFVLPQAYYAKFASHADNKWFDAVVHFKAISHITLSHIVAWFDKNLLDGTIKLFTGILSKLSILLNKQQEGATQKQMSVIFLGFFIIFAMVLLFVI